MKYTVVGIEEVYDAFDDYEHANLLAPVVVESSSISKALSEGYIYLEKAVYKKREKSWASGTFIPRLIQVIDEDGYLVYQNTTDLVRSWPFISDERYLAEETPLPNELFRMCFISYSHRNNDFARKLYEGLLQHRFMCWFAPEQALMPAVWRVNDYEVKSHLAKALAASHIVLILVSQHSIQSEWVRFEITTAHKNFQLTGQPNFLGLQIDDSIIQTSWMKSVLSQDLLFDFSKWQDRKWMNERIDLLANSLVKFFPNKVNNSYS